jgi:hypothetical protein
MADAVSSARSILGAPERARVLTGLVTPASDVTDQDISQQLMSEIESTVGRLADRQQAARLLATVALAAAEARNIDQATRLLDLISSTNAASAPTLVSVAGVAALTGDFDRAERVVRTISEPELRATALGQLAALAAQAGDLSRARELAAKAEDLAHNIPDQVQHARVLSRLVTEFAQAGELGRARRLLGDAEEMAHTIANPTDQAQILTGLVTASANARDFGRARRLAGDAEEMAHTIANPTDQAQILTGLVTASADARDFGRARRLAGDAEEMAHTIANPTDQAQILTGLVTAALGAGELDEAEQAARAITTPYAQVQALSALAAATAQAGHLDHAYRLADDAEAELRKLVSEIRPPTRPTLGVLRVEIHGSWSVADLMDLLRRLEEGYRAAAAIEYLIEQSSPASQLASPSAGLHTTAQLSADELLQSVGIFLGGGLRLGSISYGSPGFLEVIGALNPLKIVKDGITENREINRKRDQTRRLDEREREKQAIQYQKDMAREGRKRDQQQQSYALEAARLQLEAETSRFEAMRSLIDRLPQAQRSVAAAQILELLMQNTEAIANDGRCDDVHMLE